MRSPPPRPCPAASPRGGGRPWRGRAPRRRRGFTLIELMIVVALVMVLSAIGITSSRELIPRYRTRKAAMTFSSHVQECRAIAVRANRECSVWLIGADSTPADITSHAGEYWIGMGNQSSDSESWDYLPVDSTSDGTDDDTSQGIVDLSDKDGGHYARRVSMTEWETINGPGSGNADRIVLSPRGFVTNPSSDFNTKGYIEVTFVNKVSRAAGLKEDFVVQVSRTGMTRIVKGDNDEYDGLTSGTTASSSAP